MSKDFATDRAALNGGLSYHMTIVSEQPVWIVCYLDWPLPGLPPGCCLLALDGGDFQGMEITLDLVASYSVFWAQVDQLKPDTQVNPNVITPIDPTALNAVTFKETSPGNFEFSPPFSRAPTGTIYIDVDGSIPSGSLAIGVGMSGSPVVAVLAEPNTGAAFTPSPLGTSCRVAISDQELGPGQVIDPTRLSAIAPLNFPPNMLGARAVLGSDGTWSVTYTPDPS
jgi:hypothetical protein